MQYFLYNHSIYKANDRRDSVRLPERRETARQGTAKEQGAANLRVSFRDLQKMLHRVRKSQDAY